MDFILEAIPLVNKNMYPLTWQHTIGILVVLLAGYFVVRSLFRIPLVRWTYASVLVIFIANLFHRGEQGKAAVNIFKLALI